MKLTINSSKLKYDIYIENNLLDHIEDFIDISEKYVIISDDNIPKTIVNKVVSKLSSSIFINFPEGEGSKSFLEYTRILNLLLKHDVTKDTTIIALGGGVTGDLVGFVCSTLYRGVKFIQIPTTLLSQIDSSVGGKVAINANNIKNAVGTIYPPSMVLIDPSSLQTLPERHFNNGMAEMIKYAMINSRDLFDFICTNNVRNHLDKLIYDCLKIKKYYVEIDEFDKNERNILNFGHTFGHAYESYYNYEKYLHGEAISLGMIQVVSSNLKDELISVLKKFSLPTSDKAKKKDLIPYIKKDKKIKTNEINLVLVNEIGKAYLQKTQIKDL
ncbi:MAG: 3-dehydroquinate synthase [Candidatus Izemoplasmatales bacterium]